MAEAKKDKNPTLVATDEQRQLAAQLHEARTAEAGWKKIANKTRERIIETLGDQVDITLISDLVKQLEVAVINESDPSQTVDWKAFRADHPELEDEIENKYMNPAKTSIRVNTNWVEQVPEGAPQE
jgi:hypothetical protein